MREGTRMGADGWKWMRMGAIGCMVRGERKASQKEPQMRPQDNIWRCTITVKKNRKRAGMVVVVREDHVRGISATKGVWAESSV